MVGIVGGIGVEAIDQERGAACAAAAQGAGAWLLLLLKLLLLLLGGSGALEFADDALAALGGEGGFRGGVLAAEAPVEQRVVDEGLEDGHEGLLVVADDAHDGLAAELVAAVDVADLHGEGEHAREPEGDPLRVLLPRHGHLEAVAEVDVDDLARDAVQHQVARVPVPEPEDVPHHRHHGQRARVVGAPLEPGFGRFGFQPQHAVEVLARRVVHGVGEDFDFLHEGEVVVVWCHLQHDAVLDVEQDAPLFAVVFDQVVQGVAVRDPAEQAGLCGERNGGELLDVEVSFEGFAVVGEEGVDEPKELHDALVLSDVFVAFESVGIGYPVAATEGHLAWTLLGWDDGEDVVEAHDSDDRLATLVGSRDS